MEEGEKVGVRREPVKRGDRKKKGNTKIISTKRKKMVQESKARNEG